MSSHNLSFTLPALLTLALVLAPLGSPAAAQDAIGAEVPTPAGPAWAISADASAGLVLASDAWDPASQDSAAAWSLQSAFLGRYEGSSWGFVASGLLDLSAPAGSGGAITPAFRVYEAYARLDLGDWGQAFLGKRRMGLGLGTTFAPGDLIDPRSGFWDQKNGFRGLDLALSLGPDVSLRGALSLERNLEAYALGLKAKAAIATPGAAAANAAYAAALGSATGPADPRLFLYALSGEALLGSLQVSASGVYSPGYAARPSLGASIDVGGLILQAEAALELEGSPTWYATGGLRYTWSGGASTLTASLDYDYNGAPGLLEHRHYALPSLSLSIDEVLSLYARALVELESPSALLSCGLTFYPAPGLDLELTFLSGLGPATGEFAGLASISPIASPATGTIRNALGLTARIHFE